MFNKMHTQSSIAQVMFVCLDTAIAVMMRCLTGGRRIVVCAGLRKCNFKWRTTSVESKIQEPTINNSNR
jgi:hypothetical protein